MRSCAVLLCRVAGLRQAIATEAPAELGGKEFTTRALMELERILSLGDCAMEKERAALGLALVRPGSNNNPMGATYRSGAWVPAFFFCVDSPGGGSFDGGSRGIDDGRSY